MSAPAHTTSAPPRSRAQQVAAYAATAAAGTILLFHFAVIFLYLTPTNPIKLRLWTEIHTYVHPLFAQNWKLFAPEPIAENQIVMVRARTRDRATGELGHSAWLDITSPVMTQIHRHRIGPMSKLARPFSGIIETMNFADPVAQSARQHAAMKVGAAFDQATVDARRRAARGDTAAQRQLRTISRELAGKMDTVMRLSDGELAQQKAGREMLYRLASAYAVKAVGPDAEVSEINVRLAREEFPRFSHRRVPDAKSRIGYSAPLGWERVRTDVTLP